jgi:hypothetical protein
MGNLLDDRASDHVANYNASCLHYNLVADALYSVQRIHDSLSPEFEPYSCRGPYWLRHEQDDGRPQ